MTGSPIGLAATPPRRVALRARRGGGPAGARIRLPMVGWPVLLGVLGTAVAAAGSWIPSLWGDEVATLLSAERPLPSLAVELAHVDAVHGAWYLVMHVWIRLFGTSAFSLRFPSALAAGAAVAAVTWVARRWASPTAGIVAGILCAVVPRLTWDGEEARSYAASAALAAWLALALLEALARGGRSRGWWVAYGVLLAAGVTVFVYLALLVAAHALALVLVARRRRVLVPWAIASGSALAACLPLLVLAWTQREQVAYLATRHEVTPQTVLVTAWFGQTPFAVVGWVLVVAGLGVTAVRLARRAAPRPRALVVAACWLLVPSTLLIGASPLVGGFTARYLAFCAPATALLAAAALDLLARGRRRVLALATAAVVALSAGPWLAERGPYAMDDSDWAVVSRQLTARAQPGDAVVFDESSPESERPRLGLRAYPVPVPLVDPTLASPYWRNATTWRDRSMSVARAAALGRFDGVRTVWLVEHAGGGRWDTDGITALERLGFQPSFRLDDPSSMVLRMRRGD